MNKEVVKSMRINITAGEQLNRILEIKYQNENFIPFNEAMTKGTYTAKLFSESFIEERAKTHSVSITKYKEKLNGFLTFLTSVELYNEVILWFGDEPFCNENRKIVLQTLCDYNYQGKIVVNTVVEETGEVIKSIIVQK